MTTRIRLPGPLALLAILLAAGAAAAEHRGIVFDLGDTVSSSIAPAEDADTWVFDGLAGTKARLDLSSESGGLSPAISLLAPSGDEVPLDARSKGSKLTVKNLVMPETGRYAVTVRGEDGSTGGYRLKTKGKPPKKTKDGGRPLAPGETLAISFPALEGTTAKVKIRAGGGGSFDVLSVKATDGTDVPGGVDALTGGKTGRGTLTDLPGPGVITITVGNAPAATEIKSVVRLKHPKPPRRKTDVTATEPTVTSVDPGFAKPGDTVTVTGADFGASGAVVLIDGAPSESVVHVSGGELAVRVPEGEGLGMDVVVYDGTGQEGTLAAGFDYVPPPPSIHSVTPVVGPSTGGTAVDVLGDDFLHVSRIELAGSEVTEPFEVFGAEHLRFTTDAAPVGPATLVLSDPFGGSSTLVAAFTFIGPPAPTSVTPDFGPAAGGMEIEIAGSGFSNDDRVFLDGVEHTPVTFLSPDRLRVTTAPHAKGEVDVRVTDAGGRSGTLPGAYEYSDGTTLNGAFHDVTKTRMPANTRRVLGDFSFSLDVGGTSLAIGDIDGDEDADLVVGGVLNSVRYYGAVYEYSETLAFRGDGSGGFPLSGVSPVGDGRPSDDAKLGDVDGDGDLDLVLTQDTIYTARYYGYGKSYGNGSTYYYYYYDQPYSSTRVFVNDGTGKFSRADEAIPDPAKVKGRDLFQGGSLALGDLDGDEDLDIVVTRERNVATSTWADTVDYYTYYAYAYYYVYRQFDTEYTESTPATRVLLNDGDGNFTETTGTALPGVAAGDMYAGDAVLLADLDGDGDLDIVVTSDSALVRDSGAPEFVSGSKTRVLLNDGDGNFTDATSSRLPDTKAGDDWGGVTLAFGDLDGDGVKDLVVAVNREVFDDSGGPKSYLPSTRVFRGSASGTFTEVTSSFLPAVATDGSGELFLAKAVAVADPDGLGQADLFLVRDGQVMNVRWLQSEGKAPLVDSTSRGLPDPSSTGDSYRGDAVLLGDVDGDADLDLVITTGDAGFKGPGRYPTRQLEFR